MNRPVALLAFLRDCSGGTAIAGAYDCLVWGLNAITEGIRYFLHDAQRKAFRRFVVVGEFPPLENLCRSRGGFFRWRGPLIIALFVRAGNYGAGLQVLQNQIFAAATCTLLRNRPVRRGEFALGIIPASIKCIALARPLLDEFAILALGTLHADKVLLHVLAFRIPAASRELAVPSVADHHIAPAFRALLIQRNVRNFPALIQPRR